MCETNRLFNRAPPKAESIPSQPNRTDSCNRTSSVALSAVRKQSPHKYGNTHRVTEPACFPHWLARNLTNWMVSGNAGCSPGAGIEPRPLCVKPNRLLNRARPVVSKLTVKTGKVTTNPLLSYQVENSLFSKRPSLLSARKSPCSAAKSNLPQPFEFARRSGHQYRRGGPDFEDFPVFCPVTGESAPADRLRFPAGLSALDSTTPLPASSAERLWPSAARGLRQSSGAVGRFSLLLSPFQAPSASPPGYAAPVSRSRLRQKPHLPPSRARTAPRRPCRRASCPQWEGASTLANPARLRRSGADAYRLHT